MNKYQVRKEYLKQWRLDNKDKVAGYRKKWQLNNKDKIAVYSKRHRIKKSYGLSEEELQCLHEKQNYKCSICEKQFDDLFVDHCHSSGKVRELLCTNCNFGIGHFKESKTLLLKAVEYLDRHGH